MSTGRTRPTREETRRRLLEGAAVVFAAEGVGGASIEEICAASGLSRGAFYSNYENKDQLVRDLMEVDQAENAADLEQHLSEVDPLTFILSMDNGERARSSITARNPGLGIELFLHLSRTPEHRSWLVQHQRETSEVTKRMVQRMADDLGIEIPGGVDDAVSLILGFDLGLSFRSMIDPESVRQGQYGETLATLYDLWTRSATKKAD